MKGEIFLGIVFLVLNTTLIILLNSLSFSLLVIGYTVIVLTSSFKIYKKEYLPVKKEIAKIPSNKLEVCSKPSNEKLVQSMKKALEYSAKKNIPLNITKRGNLYPSYKQYKKRKKNNEEKETS